ncbi:MAG: GMP synthetase, partial [Candidatus Kerfeldbacteria bacterium]|nr:GMP synthetase [Candidatus Kerfeldbacteria bacterium]
EASGKLLAGIPVNSTVWASHGDDVEKLPHGFTALAKTASGAIAAAENPDKKMYLIQFHPEVVHTEHGQEILQNFLFRIAGFAGDWKMETIVSELVDRVKKQVGNKKVLCALSGGVDSSVVATLLHQAIPGQVHAVFVDHGLLRLDEAEQVATSMKSVIDRDLVVINAKKQFLDALEGVTDPEQKRKIIGRTFIEVFDIAAQELGGADFLAQGTLYPDVIESSAVHGPSVTIKSHHNVGGLPEKMKMKLVEPLRELFKDEVREIGQLLGLPESVVGRHPQADLYEKTWQAFAVLLPIKTVGVMGDGRTYDQVIALRAVTSTDGMTADWAQLPDDFLAKVSSRIINEVKGVNRVVYDISSKPPATIEWE